ncbi:MAG TPA: hypothetical protein VFB08_19050 [Burkholderiales bacterium]|nr:hypothetical protein [Burkholderiales bacterium]
MPQIFKRGHAEDWTLDRVARLSAEEIKRLRENAARLNEPDVVNLCDQELKGRRARPARKPPASSSAR